MMSTPSSSTRVPPTSPQVTASVVKFRCLYTHDLRRKSKRWHDGYLRYHKFNKRVMVYDDQGNFIGDHHWRSSDEVQDGDEMELDKGVLIEVTENMGTTETDITTLYEKRKSSQGSPQTKDPVSHVPRTPAHTSTPTSAPIRSSGSSQSFRSLNDLLGIKRTPIRHLVPPYEERNSSRPTPSPSVRESAPAPKRQKTSSVVDRSAEKGSRARSEVIDLTDSIDSNQGLSARQKSNQLAKELPRAGGDSTGDVLLTNCEQKSTVQSKQTRSPRPNPPSFSRASASTAFEPPEEADRTATKGVQPARPLYNKSKDAPAPIQSLRPLGPSSRGPLPSIPPETEIPRPRGNFHVKQPSINRENQSKVVSRPNPPQRSDPPRVSRDSPPKAPRQPSVGRSTPQAPVRAVTNYMKPIEPANNQAPTNDSPPTNVSSLANIPPSVNIPPPANVPPPANNSPSTSMPPPALRSGAPTSALRMGTGKPRRKLMYSALLPGGSRSPSPATSDTLPTRATREPATEPPERHLTAAPSDSSIPNEEFMPSTSTQFIFDEFIDGSGFKSPSMIKRLAGKRSLDSPLRKSTSDPTALTARQVRAGRSFHAANMEDEPKEQGPWTSEALDLFDFWPAGRPKPSNE
ncbi:hypothetical protein N7517_009532 [Penicillium concentricum]|uniref:5'-3' DNA helicase ZGRF1-like N-terminal domain-containing protein n=1 Tax=Penicillium concentricum TaxID=293559 RepID=A0A9W9UZ98_9EURO|nr:uncharacterized protein N7517_009532 [Penicillium concentricum]KAJ5360341.1 hypothetical protein N7517_009532 [Penicillium concentricum]